MIEAKVEKIGSLLQFTCTGTRSYTAYIELIDLIRSELQKEREIRKVLVNFNELTGDLTILERYNIGKYLAGKFREIRIAVISPTEYLTKMVENTAVNRGVQLFSTESREKALAWLND